MNFHWNKSSPTICRTTCPLPPEPSTGLVLRNVCPATGGRTTNEHDFADSFVICIYYYRATRCRFTYNYGNQNYSIKLGETEKYVHVTCTYMPPAFVRRSDGITHIPKVYTSTRAFNINFHFNVRSDD